jgi:hypothetical protein
MADTSEWDSATPVQMQSEWDSAKPVSHEEAKRGEWETMPVPSRPKQFVSDPGQAARMITSQKGTRNVPVVPPLDRAIYEGAGRVNDVLNEMGAPAPLAAGVATAANLAGQVGSGFIGGKGAGSVAPAVEKLAHKTMTVALAPGKLARESGRGEQAVQTLLQSGGEWKVSKGGENAMNSHIDYLMGKVDDALSKSDAKVSALPVLQAMREKLKEISTRGLDYAENAKAVRDEIRKLLEHPEIREELRIPVAKANQLRKDIDKELTSKAYDFGTKLTGEKEGKLAATKGLREEINRMVPEVGPLNREAGKVINARNLVEARNLAQEARPAIGAWGWLHSNPAHALLYLGEKHPYISSSIAHNLHTGLAPNLEGLGRLAGAYAGSRSGSPPPMSELERRLSDER